MLLGTLPGAVSLKKEYYYADEKNYFWDFFVSIQGMTSLRAMKRLLAMTRSIKNVSIRKAVKGYDKFF